jgi:hypothetical protein
MLVIIDFSLPSSLCGHHCMNMPAWRALPDIQGSIDAETDGAWYRYRGDKDSNDVGITVKESEPSFVHWNRLWNIYHNRQLHTTFRELAMHTGLKVCSAWTCTSGIDVRSFPCCLALLVLLMLVRARALGVGCDFCDARLYHGEISRHVLRLATLQQRLFALAICSLRVLLKLHGLSETSVPVQIGFHQRLETFKQDNQLDVVWKMYRVRGLVLSVAAAQ